MIRQIAAAGVLTLALGAGGPWTPSGWFGMKLHAAARDDEGRIVRLGVCAVVPGGPAAEAGVRAGDALLALDGEPVRFRDEVEAMRWFGSREPGSRVTLLVQRGNRRLHLVVRVGEVPVPGASPRVEKAREGSRPPT